MTIFLKLVNEVFFNEILKIPLLATWKDDWWLNYGVSVVSLGYFGRNANLSTTKKQYVGELFVNAKNLVNPNIITEAPATVELKHKNKDDTIYKAAKTLIKNTRQKTSDAAQKVQYSDSFTEKKLDQLRTELKIFYKQLESTNLLNREYDDNAPSRNDAFTIFCFFMAKYLALVIKNNENFDPALIDDYLANPDITTSVKLTAEKVKLVLNKLTLSPTLITSENPPARAEQVIVFLKSIIGENEELCKKYHPWTWNYYLGTLKELLDTALEQINENLDYTRTTSITPMPLSLQPL